jgi:hypothetical protein
VRSKNQEIKPEIIGQTDEIWIGHASGESDYPWIGHPLDMKTRQHSKVTERQVKVLVGKVKQVIDRGISHHMGSVKWSARVIVSPKRQP